MLALCPLFVLLLLSGCASRGEEIKARSNLPREARVGVPFIEQAAYHCGPAALWMMTNFLKWEVSLARLTEMLYTPEQKGTFQNDMVAAVRRLGLLGLPINDLTSLLQELGNDNPVLIFQNLGTGWTPKWHYAVAVGYDLNKSEIFLHSGPEEYSSMDIATFERIWGRVANWGLLVVRPGDSIPKSASEHAMILASAGLESAQQFEAARVSFEQTISKWPESFGAHLGLGNYYYQRDEFDKSVQYLGAATRLNPKAAGAWHNYALTLHEVNAVADARVAALRALELVSPGMGGTYRKNLSHVLGADE